MDKDQIISIINENKNKIITDFHVKHIFLFGSYAKEKQKETSDIDILVEFEKDYKLNFSNQLNLQVFLHKLFKKDIGLCEKERVPKIYEPYIFDNNLIKIC